MSAQNLRLKWVWPNINISLRVCILKVCMWRHAGHVGGQEQLDFSPQGVTCHFYANLVNKLIFFCFVHQHGGNANHLFAHQRKTQKSPWLLIMIPHLLSRDAVLHWPAGDTAFIDCWCLAYYGLVISIVLHKWSFVNYIKELWYISRRRLIPPTASTE